MSDERAREGYLRYPTIAGETIVFVAEDDLWSVSIEGGPARRLTTSLSQTTHPSLSPDGRYLAFIAREDGPSELYVMPAEGGEATKLTSLGAITLTSGWAPDGRILFTSDAEAPFAGWRFPYAIAPTGGEPERLPWGPAYYVALAEHGGIVLGRNTRDAAHWKRYRGGTAGRFWVDPDGASGFSRWPGPDGNLGRPLWLGGRIYFTSDHEGVGNLYSARPDGSDLRRHTDHEAYYARNAQSDGRRIVYHAGGDLYLYDPADDTSRKVPVELRGPRVQRARRFVEASRYLEHVSVHPEGHSLLSTVRGRAFSFGNWEGPVYAHGHVEGARYRLASWLPDGRRFVCVADIDGEEALEVHDASGETEPKRLTGLDLGRVVELVVSPKADRAALTNHRNQLMVVDLDSARQQIVEENPYGFIEGVTWSPDGTWLAYSAPFSRQTTGIRLWKEGQAPVDATRPVVVDTAPSFDPGGKYLHFLSYRVFHPVRDELHLDLGFIHRVKPCLLTLQAETPSPFLPEPRPVVEGKSAGNGSESGSGNSSGSGSGSGSGSVSGNDSGNDSENGAANGSASGDDAQLRIDLDGIADRVLMLPVPDARYTDIEGIDGKVLFLSAPLKAEGSGENRPRGTLHAYDFKELKYEVWAEGVTGFAFSFDRKTAALRYDRRVRVVAAGKKPDEKAARDEYGRASGWVNLGRIKVAVEPEKEWAQMLREAWRLQRNQFWTPDLSGVDWDLIWRRYSALLPRIATRGDLSDLMWEMQGELGTSHAYESGGDYRDGPNYGQGFLGARFTWDAERGGYRITAVVKGDSWADDSSLRLPGVRLSVGDVIVAIDNRKLSESVSPAHCLVGKGGQEVALRVLPADGSGSRTVVVKTLTRAGELRARYREWVEANRRKVHEASGGRLGYIHVPDMMGEGFAEFHRAWLTESERDGLIVDVRHNSGGNVSELLLEKLARRAVGFMLSRWGAPRTYPTNAVLGPVVAITNEWAGSDGDIFCHSFKLMKLGPVVGKRTWGGVIGIWPRHKLVDGSYTTQPEFAFWFPDVGWGVENYGTDPDIEVDDRPEEYAAGIDAQLERAIAEAMDRLAANPPKWPTFDNRPSRALPKLPPREGQSADDEAAS